jgi:hypothetical protein
MQSPDQRLFESDLSSAEFQIGAAKGWWGVAETEVLPEGMAWPRVILWIAAVARENGPARYYFCLDAAGYRTVSPTGTFWDPATRSALDVGKRPKGRTGSRFAMVFRTDWNNAALYHPYDRVAAAGHAEWPAQLPHRIWTTNHTIADYLSEFYTLLNSGDYLGI